MPLEDVAFHNVQFWIKIHGLELQKLNESNAIIIGKSLGRNARIDSIQGPGGFDKSYFRIILEVDGHKPLVPKVIGVKRWASVKYERLTDFCFSCGCLGHTDRTCNQLMIMAEDNRNQQCYGPWNQTERPWRRETTWAEVGKGQGGSSSGGNRQNWRETVRSPMQGETGYSYPGDG